MASQLSSPKLLTPRNLAWFTGWGAALYGMLQIHLVSGWSSHTICGRWGCGPPVEALFSYHGFWFVLLIPVAVISRRVLSPAQAIRWGMVLAIASVMGIVVLVVVDAVKWFSIANSGDAYRYLFRRCLFRLATIVDFPLIQLAVLGAYSFWQGRRRVRAAVPMSVVSEQSQMDSSI